MVVLVVLFQLTGIALLFFDWQWAIIAFVLYGITVVILITVYIVERRKEKKEEIDYDDCDY
ncbi:hypothetical protein JCM9157_3423 [Halalkalibacter akibai JCM 9157]|uniref:Uncharacterized protein n=1 Tax=Halalkalibacter akibai (strain ATCC 43226 / DSM 21942 / CIP 109018 / JCM 9157 / 1139) TaxID=1236973 RepID=W4QY71_HALA3|nr:hypothetical protein JCM9157_3423 [Halalkalibacter akibai JCM 9157]